ncbi:hypothetical protein TWF730_009171 [Orbilia blumenaviensis]|uniref:Uncharacterized protein n=1 Tax=Orbilia blumenaviensis TaxID=1796055 RepID=A0AAV9UXJ2_9PEZI
MIYSVDSLLTTLLVTLAFVHVYATDPSQDVVSGSSIAVSNTAPPPGFSETLSIYGEPEPKRPPSKTPATFFTILLELSTGNEWDAFDVSTTDYTTCHTLNPALQAKKSRFRAAFSATGARDAQPGIKNMMFMFPENTIPPDISIKIFRTAPPAAKKGRVASGSVNTNGACYEAAGSRDTLILNLRKWLDTQEDDRLDWLKPSWWARFYYRLRATDSFLVLPPPVQERASLGAQRVPAAGGSTAFRSQRNTERGRERDESYEAARRLGIEFA